MLVSPPLMFRRTHWYLLLLLGTMLGIVSCSTQTATLQPGAAPHAMMFSKEIAPRDVTIAWKTRTDNDALTDVSVKDNNNGEEMVFKGLVDVFCDHYKAVQFAAGNIFVVHRTGGSEGYAAHDKWTDSLWVHQAAGSGVKLAEGRGLDARVSDDGRFVTVVTENEVLVLRDRKTLVTKPLSALMPENKESLLVAPAAVGADFSWFISNRAAAQVELVRLDNDTGAIEHTDLQNDAVGASHIHTVQPDNGKIVFWDSPFAFDVETATEYDKKESHIMVFDPTTHKTQTLLTLSPGKHLADVDWQDKDTVLYKMEGSARFEPIKL